MAQRWVPATDPGVARSMRSNVASGTRPELRLRAALAEAGITPDALNLRGIPGTPDFVWQDEAVAGFVNGCYWHRCELCGMSERPLPGGPNAELWEAKFVRNRARRREYLAALDAIGILAVECWECEAKRDIDACVARFAGALASRRQ